MIGYAVTRIARDVWERWLHENRDSEMVKSKAIFAVKNKE